MMELIGTLEGDGSANTLDLTGISGDYRKLIVKGNFRVVGNNYPKLAIYFTGASVTAGTNSLEGYITNVTSWITPSFSTSYLQVNPDVATDNHATNIVMHFEGNFDNEVTSFNKIALGYAGIANASGNTPQKSGIWNSALTNGQISAMSFRNTTSDPWATNTKIQVYGIM